MLACSGLGAGFRTGLSRVEISARQHWVCRGGGGAGSLVDGVSQQDLGLQLRPSLSLPVPFTRSHKRGKKPVCSTAAYANGVVGREEENDWEEDRGPRQKRKMRGKTRKTKCGPLLG